jgi:hypothetical protein
MTTLDELEKLLAAAQFTEKLCVSYSEIGPPDDGRLCAFLMEGDPDDGIYVAVDESPWDTADPPSPRLEAIATAINALPGLIESARRVERLEAEMGRIERNRDMWKCQVERQSEVISVMRNALKEIAGSPSGGVGCNPEGFVSSAFTALKDAP